MTVRSSCSWCGGPFIPNALGRPRRFCSVECRIANAHYTEDSPAWRARLTELEASAASYRKHRHPVPTFLVNEVDSLRRALAQGPVGSEP